MEKGTLMFALAMVLLFFISTGASYAGFKTLKNDDTQSGLISPGPLGPVELQNKRSTVDPSEPKTEACPLNGALFTKTEKKIWETRRPLGVMIENHTEARPQSGLQSADIVYEALAEGGISRFTGVFYCGASAMDVELGPIRSARTYFLDWISEFGNNPLYAHVGGANCNAETGSGCQNGKKADAIGQIIKYKWDLYNDMNQMRGTDLGIKVFRRDNRLEKFTGKTDIAIEHTMYSSTDKLYSVAAIRGLTNVDSENLAWDTTYTPWKFKKEEPSVTSTVTNIKYRFWEQFSDSYAAEWKYDPATNSYTRSTGGTPHMDLNTKQPLTAKVVIVAVMKEERANDGYDNNLHLLYTNKGTGRSLVFQDGALIEGTWKKKDRISRTQFFDKSGKEISLNPGNIWISIVPSQSEKGISYQ